MKSFKDSEGREWAIRINIGTVRRVKDEIGVNLSEVADGDPPLMQKLQGDITLFCDVLRAILKPDADKAGIDEAAFWDRLGGDAIKSAYDAFWQELADFFLNLGRRDMATAIQKQQAMIGVAVKLATARIEEIDVERECGNAFTNSLGTSAAPSST